MFNMIHVLLIWHRTSVPSFIIKNIAAKRNNLFYFIINHEAEADIMRRSHENICN